MNTTQAVEAAVERLMAPIDVYAGAYRDELEHATLDLKTALRAELTGAQPAKRALLAQALIALEESVDLVANVHADAVELYSGYPSRQAKIAGLKSDLDAHQAVIAAITAELTGAQPHDLQKRLADLHLYEEIGEFYAKCNPGPDALRDWVAERMGAQPVQPATGDVMKGDLSHWSKLVERLDKDAPVPVAVGAQDVIDELNATLNRIGDLAHDRSKGPAIHDDLWEIRRMAYEGQIEFDATPEQGDAKDASQLTPDEMQECLGALSIDHSSRYFAPTCSGCTAYKKLAAILAKPGEPT